MRGPIDVFADECCTVEAPVNVLDYVNELRFRLNEARAAARCKLGKSQSDATLIQSASCISEF